MLVVRARTAMTSEATAISNPVSLVFPCSCSPCPTVILRKKRSFVSSTLCQVIVDGSMSRRANFFFSSAFKSLGFVLLMPSFWIRFIITGEKARIPFLAGHRRLNKAWRGGLETYTNNYSLILYIICLRCLMEHSSIDSGRK